MLPNAQKITYEEFLKLDKGDDLLEFIDGYIYSQASPSTRHQRILTNLSTEFGIYFKHKQCKHYLAPYDIVLKNNSETNRVQPDISVICDKSGFNENNYTGVPSLVVEILSPSTASKDYTVKLNLYMSFGVKEYWIVSPKNKSIQVFSLQDGTYGEPTIFGLESVLSSSLFPDLSLDLKDIFDFE